MGYLYNILTWKGLIKKKWTISHSFVNSMCMIRCLNLDFTVDNIKSMSKCILCYGCANKVCRYADELQEYLVSFFERTQPLLDLEKELQPHIKEFEAKWERGELQNGSAVEKNDNNNNINNNNNNNNGTNTNTPTPTPTTTPSPAPSTTPATTSTENKKRKNKKKKNKKEKSDEPKSDTGAAEPMEVDAKKTPDFDNPLYCRACIFPSSKQSLQIITIHILITITM